MKLKRYIIPFLILLSLSLSACSAEQGEEEASVSITVTEEEADVADEADQYGTELTEELEDDGQSGRSVTDAYAEVLYAILNDHIWPDGREVGNEHLDNLTGNQFAIYDVDNDGVDELILSITGSDTVAGMSETIYRYDAATDTIYKEFTGFPGVDYYYDNGVILAGWSHNQGKGMKLWPFSLYVYDAETDSYTCVGSADSWDEDLVPDGFPSEYDTDGDGTIYYLYEANSSGDPQIADGAEYHEWLDPYLEGASLLEFQWYSLDDSGISDAVS